MAGTFWVNEIDLDADQNKAVQSMAESDSFLVVGPAGSGKTNVLLLRAKWYLLMSISDVKIITFTSSLKHFIQLGCDQYGLPNQIATTCIRFFSDLLNEYGISYENTGDFELDREMLAGKTLSLINSKNIENIHDALLVDECQDLMDTELLILRKLTMRLVLVADTRQSIYKTTHSPGLLEKLVDNKIITLKYHYRSGLKLCTVADAILKDSANFLPVRKECKYDAVTKPSSVSINECESFADQVSIILSKLQSQIDLYPGEYIGVLFPKREQQQLFKEAFENSGIDSSTIIIETMHGAKGLEFRSVHIAGCEALYRMGFTQKRLIYTAILRGKTAAAIYVSGNLPGYLDSAIAQLSPPKSAPLFGKLFSGK